MKSNHILRFTVCFCLISALFLSGCASEKADSEEYHEFVKGLANPDLFFQLDGPRTGIITSFDRSGGNNDFNNFSGIDKDGWAILADLKGPGFVSRFWTTGGKSANQRFKFYFDGEKKPRINAAIDELRRGKEPFTKPLSEYNDNCWYSYVPISYEKSLKITADVPEGGDRLFYQINYTELDKGCGVESMPGEMTSKNLMSLKQFAETLCNVPKYRARSLGNIVEIPAGGVAEIINIKQGPAVLNAFSLEVVFKEDIKAVKRSDILKRLNLRMFWDGCKDASVDVPLSPFCGGIWRRPAFKSGYFGLQGGKFFCMFPMPFQKSARIVMSNTSDVSVKIVSEASIRTLEEWGKDNGYFHSCWNRTSGPGRAHSVLKVNGKGKYAGCVLGVMSMDPNWWILESDEFIRRDGEKNAGWNGTGLEDYFDSAWYYKNNKIRAMSGLIFKAPFKTVQYRVHGLDSPEFADSVDVFFEMGPDNGSKGIMESVAFYYLSEPSRAEKGTGSPADMPPDIAEKATIMIELCNYERFGDYSGASDYIDEYLKKFPDMPFESVLRLRQIAYVEKTFGKDRAIPMYRDFIKEHKKDSSADFAKMFLWFHEKEENAILSLYSSNPAEVFIDSRKVGEVSNPEAFAVFPVTVKKGKHVLSVLAEKKKYPEWVQVCLMTHKGYFVTDKTWKCSWDGSDDWREIDFNDDSWVLTGDSFIEGPPIVPYVWTSPHPFPDMQALPLAVWSSTPQPAGRNRVFFRKVIEISE